MCVCVHMCASKRETHGEREAEQRPDFGESYSMETDKDPVDSRSAALSRKKKKETMLGGKKT